MRPISPTRKFVPWLVIAAAVAALIVMLELPRHLRGPEWAVTAAGICVLLVGAALIWWLAGVGEQWLRDRRRERDEL